MKPQYSILQGLIGAAIGLAGGVLLEFGVLMLLAGVFNARLMPRGLGWIAIPILFAITGWRFGKEIGAEAIASSIKLKLDGQDRPFRLWAAGSVVWLICALTFYGVFNPYGYYWSSSEWHQFWLVLVAPPILGLVGKTLFGWANK